VTIDIDLKREIDNSYKIEINTIDQIELSDKRVAIVTNPKVSGLHLSYLLQRLKAKELYIVTIPDGEQYKNMDSVDQILESLFNHKFNRKSVLIGFGGGVIGDITGFSASLYQRGIDFIQIPTTLLSQVDSSVGGKTGVNNRFGKNLIGAFHQPKAVYIDPHFLSTLPHREFGAGFAEVVKMAVIFDRGFFNYLKEADLSSLDVRKEMIKRSVELKADVVSKDEREGGVRASLNYGHTFGHIIENESGYGGYLHGEAVAMGMVMANRLAVKLEMMSEDEADEVKKVLERADLPTDYRIRDKESFYQKFFLDKKALDSKIKFIVPDGIGNFKFRDDLSRELLLEVLQEFC
jgi:3-dehydroquinate synthase